jgi:hypothetical protein
MEMICVKEPGTLSIAQYFSTAIEIMAGICFLPAHFRIKTEPIFAMGSIFNDI